MRRLEYVILGESDMATQVRIILYIHIVVISLLYFIFPIIDFETLNDDLSKSCTITQINQFSLGVKWVVSQRIDHV